MVATNAAIALFVALVVVYTWQRFARANTAERDRESTASPHEDSLADHRKWSRRSSVASSNSVGATTGAKPLGASNYAGCEFTRAVVTLAASSESTSLRTSIVIDIPAPEDVPAGAHPVVDGLGTRAT
jgi:hypothetical protein